MIFQFSFLFSGHFSFQKSSIELPPRHQANVKTFRVKRSLAANTACCRCPSSKWRLSHELIDVTFLCLRPAAEAVSRVKPEKGRRGRTRTVSQIHSNELKGSHAALPPKHPSLDIDQTHSSKLIKIIKPKFYDFHFRVVRGAGNRITICPINYCFLFLSTSSGFPFQNFQILTAFLALQATWYSLGLNLTP